MHPELPENARPGLAPLDEEIDHARGPSAGRLILEYGDYECPYSRQAFRAVEYVEQKLSGRVRFAFRHFPLVQIHPHAFGAAAAAEAAALQGSFWRMHELLFHRQDALEDDDLRQYADQLGLGVARFDQDRVGVRRHYVLAATAAAGAVLAALLLESQPAQAEPDPEFADAVLEPESTA